MRLKLQELQEIYREAQELRQQKADGYEKSKEQKDSSPLRPNVHIQSHLIRADQLLPRQSSGRPFCHQKNL